MKIPVLLYHDIREDVFDLSSIDPQLWPYVLKESDFIDQMKLINNQELKAIKASNLNIAEEKSVSVVFDDGWVSNYRIAYPILKEYGFSATFFVTIENIGKQGMMTWQQLKEMSDNGMEIGSHNMTHRVPLDLSKKELEHELCESKKVLEEKLGIDINCFSSPTGFYDKRIEDLAKNIGYKSVFFSKMEFNNLVNGHNGFLSISKIGVKRNDSLKRFKAIIEKKSAVLSFLRFKQKIRSLVKIILGRKTYIKVKSIILRKSV